MSERRRPSLFYEQTPEEVERWGDCRNADDARRVSKQQEQDRKLEPEEIRK